MFQMRKILARKKLAVSARRLAVGPNDNPLAGEKGLGVVGFYLQGSVSPNTTIKFDPATVIQSLEAGLPIYELDELRSGLDLPMEQLTLILGISKATLHRRKAAGRLDTSESDRVVRFARLLGKAVAVLEREEHARQWLGSPQFGLGGAIPLEYARTEVGAREVENLLGRIEFGVYS